MIEYDRTDWQWQASDQIMCSLLLITTFPRFKNLRPDWETDGSDRTITLFWQLQRQTFVVFLAYFNNPKRWCTNQYCLNNHLKNSDFLLFGSSLVMAETYFSTNQYRKHPEILFRYASLSLKCTKKYFNEREHFYSILSS